MTNRRLMDTDWIPNAVRGLLTGALSAPIITLFANTIAAMGRLNASYPYITLLLPAGAVLISLIYSTIGDRYRKATVYAIDEIHISENEKLNLAQSQNTECGITPQMGIIGFMTSALSHLLGASVGKEGVGVQLGLSAGDLISRMEGRLLDNRTANEPYYLMAGASAAFGTLFGSPISGVLFGIQFASPSFTRLDALMPCTIASFTSVMISRVLGIHILTIPAISALGFSLTNAIAVSLFAIAIGLLSRFFCFAMRKTSELNRIITKGNKYASAILPSFIVLIILAADYALTGDQSFCGLSASLLYSSMSDSIPLYSFALKALLVFLSISAGFTGGEVVPLMVTGAALGYSIADIMGLQHSAFAALGALGMLSGGTNLPLVCFALGLELFRYSEPGLLFVAVTLAYIASGNEGIYAHQRNSFR